MIRMILIGQFACLLVASCWPLPVVASAVGMVCFGTVDEVAEDIVDMRYARWSDPGHRRLEFVDRGGKSFGVLAIAGSSVHGSQMRFEASWLPLPIEVDAERLILSSSGGGGLGTDVNLMLISRKFVSVITLGTYNAVGNSTPPKAREELNTQIFSPIVELCEKNTEGWRKTKEEWRQQGKWPFASPK